MIYIFIIFLLDDNIKFFMSVYRARAHSSITVKMHILEDHVVDFIKRHKVGLGFAGGTGCRINPQ
jgi:hypothetical protein